MGDPGPFGAKVTDTRLVCLMAWGRCSCLVIFYLIDTALSRSVGGCCRNQNSFSSQHNYCSTNSTCVIFTEHTHGAMISSPLQGSKGDGGVRGPRGRVGPVVSEHLQHVLLPAHQIRNNSHNCVIGNVLSVTTGPWRRARRCWSTRESRTKGSSGPHSEYPHHVDDKTGGIWRETHKSTKVHISGYDDVNFWSHDQLATFICLIEFWWYLTSLFRFYLGRS